MYKGGDGSAHVKAKGGYVAPFGMVPALSQRTTWEAKALLRSDEHTERWYWGLFVNAYIFSLGAALNRRVMGTVERKEGRVLGKEFVRFIQGEHLTLFDPDEFPHKLWVEQLLEEGIDIPMWFIVRPGRPIVDREALYVAKSLERSMIRMKRRMRDTFPLWKSLELPERPSLFGYGLLGGPSSDEIIH